MFVYVPIIPTSLSIRSLVEPFIPVVHYPGPRAKSFRWSRAVEHRSFWKRQKGADGKVEPTMVADIPNWIRVAPEYVQLPLLFGVVVLGGSYRFALFRNIPSNRFVPSLRIQCPKTRFTPGNSLQSVPISLTSLRVRAASPLLPGQAHGKVDEDCCALGTANQTCWWSWAKYIWVEGQGERERERERTSTVQW